MTQTAYSFSTSPFFPNRPTGFLADPAATRRSSTRARCSGIFGGELMAADAVRFASIDRRPRVASHEVFKRRHRFQVSGIETRSISAQVVDVKANWDRPLHKFIGQAVKHYASALTVFLSAGKNIAVPSHLSRPCPAIVRTVLLKLRNARFKSFWMQSRGPVHSANMCFLLGNSK